jgi:uncharacterized protein (DUF488 family)
VRAKLSRKVGARRRTAREKKGGKLSGRTRKQRRAKKPVGTIFTIGHSNRTAEAFLALLRAHRIERVADIRTIPRSRRNPQFNRDALRARLRARRVAYRHLPALGGLRHPRADSRNRGWRNASFRGFADYMETTEFAAGLERLIGLAREKRTAMLCAEAVPWRCHRSLVADALLIRGIPVAHILSGKRARAHALTPFARVRKGRISYPAEDAGATG